METIPIADQWNNNKNINKVDKIDKLIKLIKLIKNNKHKEIPFTFFIKLDTNKISSKNTN